MKHKQALFFIISLFIALGTVGIRIYQVKYAIDKTTGYYINGNQSVLFLNITIVLFAIVALIALILIKNRDVNIIIPFKTEVSGFYRIGSLLAFAGIIFSIIAYIFAKGYKIITEMNSIQIINAIFGIFLIVYILSATFEINYKNKKFKQILSIAPALWFLILLIEAFFKYTSVANISEHIFEMLMLSALALFFISVAKSHFIKSNSKPIFIYGLIAVFTSAIHIVPQFVNIFYNHIDDVNVIFNIGKEVFNFGILLFVISIILPHKNSVVVETDEIIELSENLSNEDFSDNSEIEQSNKVTQI